MTTLLICELSEIVAAGIAAVVEQLGCKVVARCGSGDEVLRMAELLRPNMILASSRALGEAAIATIRTLKAGNCRPRIILLLDTDPAADVAKFKVDGVLTRNASAATLLECVNSLQEGRPWLDPDLLQQVPRSEHTEHNLTSREREIVHLVAFGMSNKEIARQANLSEGTVKTYLHHILAKLRLGNRTQLAWFAHSGVLAGNPKAKGAFADFMNDRAKAVEGAKSATPAPWPPKIAELVVPPAPEVPRAASRRRSAPSRRGQAGKGR
jgi:two-component system, NarL family, nitrate/nitrite response regulator NarL